MLGKKRILTDLGQKSLLTFSRRFLCFVVVVTVLSNGAAGLAASGKQNNRWISFPPKAAQISAASSTQRMGRVKVSASSAEEVVQKRCSPGYIWQIQPCRTETRILL